MMRLFISWSGPTSQQIAAQLYDWIPYVVPSAVPFITTNDIEKGAKWQGEISRELEASSFGIVCLTADNLTSQWIAFEAGALAKHIEGKVATVLFGVAPNAVPSPLSMFQATRYSEAEMRQLVGTLNGAAATEERRTDAQLDVAFGKFWPDLKQFIDLVLQDALAQPAEEPPSKLELMSQEMMALLRQQNSLLLAATESMATARVRAPSNAMVEEALDRLLAVKLPKTKAIDGYFEGTSTPAVTKAPEKAKVTPILNDE